MGVGACRRLPFGVFMKILLGMSGGLDSTYAAYKLLRDGHTVEGAVLKMHGHTEISGDLLGGLGVDTLFSSHFQIGHQTTADAKLVTEPTGADALLLTKLLNILV